jgi:hypothetical protein
MLYHGNKKMSPISPLCRALRLLGREKKRKDGSTIITASQVAEDNLNNVSMPELMAINLVCTSCQLSPLRKSLSLVVPTLQPLKLLRIILIMFECLN